MLNKERFPCDVGRAGKVNTEVVEEKNLNMLLEKNSQQGCLLQLHIKHCTKNYFLESKMSKKKIKVGYSCTWST